MVILDDKFGLIAAATEPSTLDCKWRKPGLGCPTAETQQAAEGLVEMQHFVDARTCFVVVDIA